MLFKLLVVCQCKHEFIKKYILFIPIIYHVTIIRAADNQIETNNISIYTNNLVKKYLCQAEILEQHCASGSESVELKK